LRIENRFFGEPCPLSSNVALFKYASRENIFFLLSCENEKVDFSKCQLLQQHLLDPSNINITKSSQLLLISHAVFNGVHETKRLSLSVILSVA